jgi:hypothetical protein
MGTILTADKYPAICAAFALIDKASDGAELPAIPPVYDVPDYLLSTIGPAERALMYLQTRPGGLQAYLALFLHSREATPFATVEAAEWRAAGAQANKLLNAYFDGWEPDYANI